MRVLAAAFVCLFWMFLGWGLAHDTVAKECDRLGRFYVVEVVYDCKQEE